MMKKWYGSLLCVAGLLALAPSIHAQADYTAVKTSRVQAGAGLLYLQPDYTNDSIKGYSVWGDYDFRRFIGVEVEAHLGDVITPADINENSYMVGPRALYHKRKFTGYAKLMFGRATITNTDFNASSSYNVYAFGGGLEYRVLRRINIRAVDFELQKWPDFEPHGLSPLAITFGASYIIW